MREEQSFFSTFAPSFFRDAGKSEGDIKDLLLAQTVKECETQQLNEEIMELLNKPTNKVSECMRDKR